MERCLEEDAVTLYDTTLRDGTQRKGISLSVGDKLKIAALLDEFGIPYIECGWPGSNIKDQEFFERAKHQRYEQARLVAFGSTRRKLSNAKDDTNLTALLRADTPAVALVGKSSVLHVERVLETTRDENLNMIAESVALLVDEGREVIFDAEHFFDGYLADSTYALSCLESAARAGANWLVLCDTNGGSLPAQIAETVSAVRSALSAKGIVYKLGIHTHNDAELAVANSLAAVLSGCRQIQGTINGYGERCGNANLISLIPTLQLKLGRYCLPEKSLGRLTEIARKVSEIANLSPDSQAPYVGSSAFAHKGGIHVAAVEKIAHSYEHIDPLLVGNSRDFVVSELAGRGNIRQRALKMGEQLNGNEAEVLSRIKELESKGFQFDNAEASFALLIARCNESYEAPFKIMDAMVVCEQRQGSRKPVQAIVKIKVGNELQHTASEGDGPVHALDQAMRKALQPTFPELEEMRLTDYKVRILDPEEATAAMTRVLLEAAYQDQQWTTVGCSENIIEASQAALVDSVEYFLKIVVAAAAGKTRIASVSA
jgi:2-isopropylmalate synthase